MALTIRTYTGDGVRTLYPVDFDLGYLNNRDYVFVYQGSPNEFANQLSYVWVNDSQIELSTPVPSGQEFHIRRIIPRDDIVNNYSDGAILREKELDESYSQAIMILQEIQDGFIDVSGKFVIVSDLEVLGDASIDGDLDMLLHSIKNLADATDSKDAVNLSQMIQAIADRSFVGVDVLPIVMGRQYGDGSTTVFQTPATTYDAPQTMFVSIEGLMQRPTTDFTILANGDIQFDEAPPVNTTIDITYFKANVSLEGTGLGMVHVAYTSNGANVSYTLHPNASENTDDQIVSIEGILQEPTIDFNVSNNVLTFNEAPPVATRIVLRSIKRIL